LRFRNIKGCEAFAGYLRLSFDGGDRILILGFVYRL
jgi:hypothetical protein